MVIMSRFQREISGSLGTFWKERAEEEVKKLLEQSKTDIIVESDGAIKWKTNSNYVPDDVCEKLEYAGFKFNRTATKNKKDKQSAEFIKTYIENNKNRDFTEEEKIEMNATFGPDTNVVDVLSGRQYRTRKIR